MLLLHYVRCCNERFQTDECRRRPCPCEYCELVFTAENHAEHVEYCSSRTDPCSLCGQFVKLRDRNLHSESNCSLPPAPAPQASRSDADEFACDGSEAYRLSQLDHFLCHDIVAGSTRWMSGPRANVGHYGMLGHATPPLVGKLNLSRGFVKRNYPGHFVDRRDKMYSSDSRNNDVGFRAPKVMNAALRGDFTTSTMPNSDDAGEGSSFIYFCLFIY